MARELPGSLASKVDEPTINPFLALRIELPDPVYVFTGRGTIEFADSDGTTRRWLGAGELGALESIGESTDGSATGVRAALYQIPSEFRADLEQQAVRGAKMEVYVGALNETFQRVDSVVLLNRYRLDQYKITDGGDTISVEVTGESRAIDARRPAVKRMTHEYQTRKHPGDKFFEYLSRMTEIPILWSAARQDATVSGGGGGGVTGGTPISGGILQNRA